MNNDGEIIVIDSSKEKDWQTKYLHRSWTPFGGKVVKKEAKKKVPTTSSIEELRSKYVKKFKKNVPNRYKNDVKWIEKKLNE